jgi:hypothetical protein
MLDVAACLQPSGGFKRLAAWHPAATRPLIGMRATGSLGKDMLAKSSAGTNTGSDFGGDRA